MHEYTWLCIQKINNLDFLDFSQKSVNHLILKDCIIKCLGILIRNLVMCIIVEYRFLTHYTENNVNSYRWRDGRIFPTTF